MTTLTLQSISADGPDRYAVSFHDPQHGMRTFGCRVERTETKKVSIVWAADFDDAMIGRHVRTNIPLTVLVSHFHTVREELRAQADPEATG